MHKHRFILPLTFLIPLIFPALPIAAQPAAVSSIKPEDLVEYEHQAPIVKQLIDKCLGLTCMDLAYTFGSDSPAKGGMDCSGTISHALKSMGLKGVPRTSYTIYHWANDHGNLTKFKDVHSTSHSVFEAMKPGDLVFWEGTYSVKERNPPISHVMLYLGRLKKDGQGVLFGASSGRRFRGKKIHGVSVFDFKVPSASSKARMVAFGTIPGIAEKAAAEMAPKPPEKKRVFFKKKEPKPELKTNPELAAKPPETSPAEVKEDRVEAEKPSPPTTKKPTGKSPAPKNLAEKIKQMKGNKQPLKKFFSNNKKPKLFNR